MLQRRQNHRTFALQRINCDKHPELVERYAIKQMPTLIVIESRRVLGRIEGSCGCREIEKLLEPWLNREAERGPVENGTKWSPHAVAAVSNEASESRREGFGPARAGGTRNPSHPSRAPPPQRASRSSAGRRLDDGSAASTMPPAGGSETGRSSARAGTARNTSRQSQSPVSTIRPCATTPGSLDASTCPAGGTNSASATTRNLRRYPSMNRINGLTRPKGSRWSRNELRIQLRNEKRGRAPGGVKHVRLNVDTARVERWKAAAEAERLDLTDWIVAAADNAARDVVGLVVATTST